MKSKNILYTLFTVAFLFGTLAINAQTKIYVHKSDGTATEFNIADIDSINFSPRESTIDYRYLMLTEVSGNNKYVEIYNASVRPIPLSGVKLQRNDGPAAGGSEWVGKADDVIPIGAFRLVLFNNYTPASLNDNPAFVGWEIGSGISSGQILKVAIVDPEGNEVSVFIRGNVPLPAWGSTTDVTQNTTDSYSLMDNGTWAYADPTPGAKSGSKKSEIASPGYLTAQPVDYSKLKLNEVNGTGTTDCDKFYELINLGTKNINLAGCKIYYNANGSTGGTLPTGKGKLTWTGVNTQVAKAGQLFSLIGRNGGDCSNPPTQNSFTEGLTAQRILIITLEDPNGNVIDQCIRSQDTGDYAITDKSFSRIPDGTGPFYFTTPTPNQTNGTNTTGLIKLPGQEPLVDYKKLVLNEISGENLFIEIFNSGTAPIDLDGVKVQRNGGPSAGTEWVGKAGDVIPAGAYRLIAFRNGDAATYPELAGVIASPAYVGWTVSGGLSDQQTLKIALVDPLGVEFDVFVRGKSWTGPWGTTGQERRPGGVTGLSYSRQTNGTWGWAPGTPGVVNATTTAPIVNDGYLTAKP